jgi:hypothetical protein
LVTGQTMKKDVLDKTIEDWFESKWQCQLDFDIGDALDKLLTLGLVTESQGLFCASPLSGAIEMLKKRADKYFQSESAGRG